MEPKMSGRISRRQILRLVGVGGAAAVLSACSQAPAPSPTTAPAAPQPTTAPAAAQPTAAPKAAASTPAPAAVATGAPAAAIKRGGTAKVLIRNDIQAMWPTISPTPVPVPCYDTLVRWRRGADGRWSSQPGLAESWEQTDKALTFKLRKGVKFHDGSVFNADVVKWNVEMFVTHPKSLAKQDLKSVDPKQPATVIDEYTVRVNLLGPSAPLITVLGDSFFTTSIVSKAAYEKLGEEGMGKQAIGSGPFRLEKWEPGNQTTFTRFEEYWDKGADGKALPYLDKLIYRYIKDDSVRTLEMLAGTGDFVHWVRPADVEKVKADPKLVYQQGDWVSAAHRLVFNGVNPPFNNNPKLRQAVLYAIDREAMARALGGASAVAMKYDIRPGQVGYDESLPYYGLDQAKAKQLLSEAGYPNGVEVVLTVISREADTQQAQMLQQMLGKVGITLKLEIMERTAAVAKVRTAGDFQMYTQMSANFADPDAYLTLVWDSKSPAPFQRVEIPEMDKALAEARSTLDPKARHEKYKVVQQIMFDTAWWGFLWAEPLTYAWQKRLRNVPAMWDHALQSENWWLDA